MEATNLAFAILFARTSPYNLRQTVNAVLNRFNPNLIGESLAKRALLEICLADPALVGEETMRRAKCLAIDQGYFSGEPNNDELASLYYQACSV